MKALITTFLILVSLSSFGMNKAVSDLHTDGKCEHGPGLKPKMAAIDALIKGSSNPAQTNGTESSIGK